MVETVLQMSGTPLCDSQLCPDRNQTRHRGVPCRAMIKSTIDGQAGCVSGPIFLLCEDCRAWGAACDCSLPNNSTNRPAQVRNTLDMFINSTHQHSNTPPKHPVWYKVDSRKTLQKIYVLGHFAPLIIYINYTSRLKWHKEDFLCLWRKYS